MLRIRSHFYRIRIQSEKIGSESGFYFYMPYILRTENFISFYYMIWTSSDTQHLIAKNNLGESYFGQHYISRKINLQGSVSGLMIRIRIRNAVYYYLFTLELNWYLICLVSCLGLWCFPFRAVHFNHYSATLINYLINSDHCTCLAVHSKHPPLYQPCCSFKTSTTVPALLFIQNIHHCTSHAVH